MAVRHKKYPIEGLQLLPESIRTKPYGMKILRYFLEVKKKQILMFIMKYKIYIKNYKL